MQPFAFATFDVLTGIFFQLNVLIDDNGRAVLCDFGLSRMASDITSGAATSNSEGIIGSRNWMAPERLMGGSLSKASDIYAFGMTLYEVSCIHVAIDPAE
jgi:serine/threonine protein kinase